MHHRHHVDEAGLDKQIGNGAGMAALLTKAISKALGLCTLVGRIPGILKRIKPGGAWPAVTIRGSSPGPEIRGFLEEIPLPVFFKRNRLARFAG